MPNLVDQNYISNPVEQEVWNWTKNKQENVSPIEGLGVCREDHICYKYADTKDSVATEPEVYVLAVGLMSSHLANSK